MLAIGMKATNAGELARLTGMTVATAERFHRGQMRTLRHLAFKGEHLGWFANFIDEFTDDEEYAKLVREIERKSPGSARLMDVDPYHRTYNSNATTRPSATAFSGSRASAVSARWSRGYGKRITVKAVCRVGVLARCVSHPSNLLHYLPEWSTWPNPQSVIEPPGDVVSDVIRNAPEWRDDASRTERGEGNAKSAYTNERGCRSGGVAGVKEHKGLFYLDGVSESWHVAKLARHELRHILHQYSLVRGTLQLAVTDKVKQAGASLGQRLFQPRVHRWCHFRPRIGTFDEPYLFR